jgi:Flp pilus assembly protein CpaB
MSRTVLIILAALAAAIVIGVLGWRYFGSRDKAADGETPRIAIVTDQLLRAAADANQKDVDETLWASQVRQDIYLAQRRGGGIHSDRATGYLEYQSFNWEDAGALVGDG